MKREEEEEELVVSVDEEDVCATDIQPHDIRSVVIRPLLQGRGRHLVVKHLNCSSFSQRVLNIPNKTFIHGLYICFTIGVILSLNRIGYEEHIIRTRSVVFGFYVFNTECMLFFVMFATVVVFALAMSRMKMKMKMKSCGSAPQRKDVIPTVSATVQQV